MGEMGEGGEVVESDSSISKKTERRMGAFMCNGLTLDFAIRVVRSLMIPLFQDLLVLVTVSGSFIVVCSC